jgi:two-component system sensor histidine kinase KdpD
LGPLAAATGALAVLAFNWRFVPPRHKPAVDLRQHALLRVAMLMVNLLMAGLMRRLRRQRQRAAAGGRREAQPRAWGDRLRGAEDPLLHAGADDSLVKPFSIGELLARMRVALRQRGGQPVHLTPTEFRLLAQLRAKLEADPNRAGW